MNTPTIIRLQMRLQELQQSVLETPPADWAQFREMVGYSRGLKEALEILFKELRDDDDSDGDEAPRF